MKKILFIFILILVSNFIYSQDFPKDVKVTSTKPYFQSNVKIGDTLGIKNLIIFNDNTTLSSATGISTDTTNLSDSLRLAWLNKINYSDTTSMIATKTDIAGIVPIDTTNISDSLRAAWLNFSNYLPLSGDTLLGPLNFKTIASINAITGPNILNITGQNAVQLSTSGGEAVSISGTALATTLGGITFNTGGTESLIDASATNQTWTLPNSTGTIALTTDIPSAIDTTNLSDSLRAAYPLIESKIDSSYFFQDPTKYNLFYKGVGTIVNLAASSGIRNTGIGVFAGERTSTGEYNAYNGFSSGQWNQTGSYNTFLGAYSGQNNEGGDRNVNIGMQSSAGRIGAEVNDAVTIGYRSAFVNESNGVTFLGSYTGSQVKHTLGEPVLIGKSTGQEADSITYFVGIGGLNSRFSELLDRSVAVGYSSLAYQDEVKYTTAIGHEAGMGNTVKGDSSKSQDNVFIGMYSGRWNNGQYNQALIGNYSFSWDSTASHDNVALGHKSAQYGSGARNTYLGSQTATWFNVADWQTEQSWSGNDRIFIGYNTGSAKADTIDNLFILGVDSTADKQLMRGNIDGLNNSLDINGDFSIDGNFTTSSDTIFRDGDTLLLPAGSGTIGKAGTVFLNTTTGPTNGVITQSGSPILQTYGTDNMFFGVSSGNYTLTGTKNFCFGNSTGRVLSTGSNNFISGFWAGFKINTGASNTIIGNQSGFNNTSGSFNNFIGPFTGYDNTSGSNNTFIGNAAGANNTTASSNTFIGTQAGELHVTGDNNAYIGPFAGSDAVSGTGNAAIGYEAMIGGTGATPSYNSIFGYQSGKVGTTLIENAFMGRLSGGQTTTGSKNAYFGSYAGYGNVVGDSCVAIGFEAGFNETASQRLHIANNRTKSLIYGEFDNNKVGVNTTSPDSTLTVDGGAHLTGGLKVEETIKQKYLPHARGGFENSSVSISLTASTWAQYTNATKNLWTGISAYEITMSGDTMIIPNTGNYFGNVSITFNGAKANQYQFRLYNVTTATQVGYLQGTSTPDVGYLANVVLPVFIENVTPNSRYVLQVQNITGSNAVLPQHGQFWVQYSFNGM